MPVIAYIYDMRKKWITKSKNEIELNSNDYKEIDNIPKNINHSYFEQFFSCFLIQKNYSSLMSSKKYSNALPVVDGLK